MNIPDFGDYVSIEMKRYAGAPNEFYTHKVIGSLKSNSYTQVPVDSAAHGAKSQIHKGDCVPIIKCICCGVDESEVVRFRASDIHSVKYNGQTDWQEFKIKE